MRPFTQRLFLAMLLTGCPPVNLGSDVDGGAGGGAAGGVGGGTATGGGIATGGGSTIGDAGPPQLAFLVQPATTAAGAIVMPGVQIALQDAVGSTDPNATDSVTVAIGNHAGAGTLSGTLTVPAVNGIAVFSDLSVDQPGQGYTLTAAANGHTGATSAAFDITAEPKAITLVKDISPGRDLTVGSSANGFTAIGNTVLFAATDEQSGRELWATDGTPGGTRLLKDIAANSPTLASSDPQAFTLFGNAVYFIVRTSDFQTQLWKFDGTDAGTVLAASPPDPGWDAVQLTVVGGALYLDGYDTAHGVELWRSDGTQSGTARVLDINPGALSSMPKILGEVNGRVVFSADDGVHGDELWATDGTSAGTAMLLDINPTGASHPGRPSSALSAQPRAAAAGGLLYFLAEDPVNRQELWVTDGTTAGTHLVVDLNPLAPGSAPDDLVFIGGTLFFSANDGVHGRELWALASAVSSPALVLDIKPGLADSAPSKLTELNGVLYFTADDGVHGIELWRSDGTPGGTSLVSDIYPGTASSGPNPQRTVNSRSTFPVMGGALYFVAGEPVHGVELWKSDGTAQGTVLVSDITPTVASPFVPHFLTPAGNTLYFTADDSVHGQEPWASDGTSAGTRLLRDIGSTTGSAPSAVVTAGDKLFFSAHDPVKGVTLWGSDGTTAGTFQLQTPTAGYTIPVLHPGIGSTLYFEGSDALTGYEPWKSDGTPAGTMRVADLEPGSGSSGAFYYDGVALGGLVLFAATETVHGIELYKTDGTAAGSGLVKDINPFPNSYPQGSSIPGNLTVFRGLVYFSADDGTHGFELWSTDGSSAGTQLLFDINPTGNAFPQLGAWLKPTSSGLYFSARDGAHGRELWKSDGTPAGTVLVKDIWPGPDESTSAVDVGHLGIELNGKLYFVADDGTHGRELWVTDGTDTGTVMVADVNPGTATSSPSAPLLLGSRLLFVADDGVHGAEPWSFDASGPGLSLLADVRPGPVGSGPKNLSVVGGRGYFIADDGVHGPELWATDGTPAGTVLLADANPGAGSSYPSANAVELGGNVFFVASDGVETALWTTAGTPATTHRVCDPANHFRFIVRALTTAGGQLYFQGDSSLDDTGLELYRLDVSVALPAHCP